MTGCGKDIGTRQASGVWMRTNEQISWTRASASRLSWIVQAMMNS